MNQGTIVFHIEQFLQDLYTLRPYANAKGPFTPSVRVNVRREKWVRVCMILVIRGTNSECARAHVLPQERDL